MMFNFDYVENLSLTQPGLSAEDFYHWVSLKNLYIIFKKPHVLESKSYVKCRSDIK